MFALVDVNYENVLPSIDQSSREHHIISHLSEVALALLKHNGLDYVPRERNVQGRVFEHAADSKVLIDHLADLKSTNMYKAAEEN